MKLKGLLVMIHNERFYLNTRESERFDLALLAFSGKEMKMSEHKYCPKCREKEQYVKMEFHVSEMTSPVGWNQYITEIEWVCPVCGYKEKEKVE